VGVNAATVGVQYLFSQLYLADEWREVVSAHGFHNTFSKLYGDPFTRAIDPLLPPGLVQPPFQLPFEPYRIWAYTGGPHGAWGDGSAWGALDFAPPGYVSGCVLSNEWVVAIASGLVLRTETGAVYQDLDSDGNEGTGWVIFYMHIEERDRVQAGTYLRAGDRIGHPSCEGGVSTGTHVHLARKYNGHWIAADGPLPFNLEGWISGGAGQAYEGTLYRGNVTLRACECRASNNQLSR
jgi:murein DD-endopeptidase MepM/ murein hydrolase activator NlpD